MPSSIGMIWNHPADVPGKILDQSLGSLFRNAGYETVYGGKVHLPGALNDVRKNGYRVLTTDARQGLADACADFIGGKHSQPFLLFASFVNPHDICYLAINDALRAKGDVAADDIDSRTCEAVAAESRSIAGTAEWETLLPPLPVNHEIAAKEPEAVSTEYLPHTYMGVQYRRHARDSWGEKEWRIFRHVYRRLTEMVDRKIGQVLDALRCAGLEEDTLVVFTSDHGDMDGAHRLQHKSVLYEEAARVPFIVSRKGVIPEGVVDDTHLVSNGLDLLPTVCDAAGITCPDGLYGRSVLPLALGADVSGHGFVVVESLHGRMLRTDRFKYSIYGSGKNREQLIDLRNDPGEMTNLVDNGDYAEVLDRHRRLLKAWIDRTGDCLGAKYVIV
jgi:arylsulfatase A-like enzyme